MPFYEYECRECTHRFEELVRGEEPAFRCPKCQAGAQRVFSTFSVGKSEGPRPAAAPRPMGPCGSCGDPRGPGACAIG